MSSKSILNVSVHIEPGQSAIITNSATISDSASIINSANAKLGIVPLGPGVELPMARLTPTQTVSGYGSGTICVRGNTGNANRDRIYVSLDGVPMTHFATAAADGSWEGTLAGVTCGTYAAPTAHNLRVWSEDVATHTLEGPVSINFSAFAANYHECLHATARPECIPVAWPAFWIVAQGFSEELSPLAGERLVVLSREESTDEAVTWIERDRERHAEERGSVSLRLILPYGHWEVRYQLGEQEVIYRKPCADWNAVGANVLVDPQSAIPSKAVAQSVRVQGIV